MPRDGHKFSSWSIRSLSTHFNPRAPRGARRSATWRRLRRKHFNPRAPRGARRVYKLRRRLKKAISIHVPREGHDKIPSMSAIWCMDFNPRAPRGARPWCRCCRFLGRPYFNPRAPRGARLACILSATLTLHFNPRAPRGARRNIFLLICNIPQFQSTCPARGTTIGCRFQDADQIISIHVPREGHDQRELVSWRYGHGFQSTCPARGTT